MKIEQKIIKEVKKLNEKTPDKIADFLLKKKIKGNTLSPGSCVLHNYLCAKFKRNHRQLRNPDTLSIGRYITLKDEIILNLDFFNNVENFISNFDDNQYPGLVNE